jgi:hypothetical protein
MRGRMLVVGALVAAAASCTPTPTPTAPVVVAGWHEVPLPATGARILSIVPTGDGLLVTGSVAGQQSRSPGAWTTTDGHTWHALSLHPRTPYAHQAELIMATLVDGRLTAYGQAFGGAHSLPRPTLWSGTTSNGLNEYEQPFEMFGGPHAIATSDEAALPGTVLLAGSWDGATGRYGAAVWTSPDGAAWHRDADDPALASAPGEQTSALGATAGPDGFLVTGYTQRGARLDPLAWTSADAGRTWRRMALPGGQHAQQYGATANRAACDSAGCVLTGAGIGPRWQALCWPVTSAGHIPAGAEHGGPMGSNVQVSQVILHDGRALAAFRVDTVGRLESISRDCAGWRDIALPVRSDEIRVGVLGGRLLLATTGATSSRLWLRPES